MTLVRGAIVRKEIREILRDRRAILLSFLLPIFVYPATFSFMSWLERRDEAKLEEDVFAVVVTVESTLVGEALAADARLRVTPIFVPVKISPVGFKDVLDPVPKGPDEFSAASAKFHVFDDSPAANGGQFFQ